MAIIVNPTAAEFKQMLAEKKMTLLKSFCKSSNLSVMIVISLFLYI